MAMHLVLESRRKNAQVGDQMRSAGHVSAEEATGQLRADEIAPVHWDRRNVAESDELHHCLLEISTEAKL
jgi:hypothetical protein